MIRAHVLKLKDELFSVFEVDTRVSKIEILKSENTSLKNKALCRVLLYLHCDKLEEFYSNMERYMNTNKLRPQERTVFKRLLGHKKYNFIRHSHLQKFLDFEKSLRADFKVPIEVRNIVEEFTQKR